MELPTPETLYHYGFVLSVGNICFFYYYSSNAHESECYFIKEKYVVQHEIHPHSYIFLIGEETK